MTADYDKMTLSSPQARATSFCTHIIQIILEILILSPDDAHGWVRALSPKLALLCRKREGGREGEERGRKQDN